MEKSTPHNKLAIVKSMVQAGQVRATSSAFQGALELGIVSLGEMCEVVLSLQGADFYKSVNYPGLKAGACKSSVDQPESGTSDYVLTK